LPDHAHLAVLGQPIAHSRSPRIHAAAYSALGLDWQYEAIECGEAELEPFLAERDEHWRGLSLTMPLKLEAHRLAAVCDPVAAESGVVNTLLRVAGAQWAGFNTDVGGLAAALRESDLDATSTIVIGSGATALSAILAARQLGAAHIEILARNTRAITDLIARFGASQEPGSERSVPTSGTAQVSDPAHASNTVQISGTVLPRAETAHAVEALLDPRQPTPNLVISTLPGPAAASVELPEQLMAVPLFDVAYDPWPSPLAARWRSAGGVAHSGLEMLVQQALLQVRIFVHGDPAIPLEDEAAVLTAMRQAAQRGVEE